jgi:hypothetical protein
MAASYGAKTSGLTKKKNPKNRSLEATLPGLFRLKALVPGTTDDRAEAFRQVKPYAHINPK